MCIRDRYKAVVIQKAGLINFALVLICEQNLVVFNLHLADFFVLRHLDERAIGNTYGKSEGRSGSYSTNYQISGRELLTPDEVRMLDNQYAILFIRGERPVLDFKYDILKHPNVALTADGKAGVYKHGEVKSDVATIELISLDKNKAPEITVAETHYELLSDEDFETK